MPVDAFYRVKDAVEDGKTQDVIDGFTERGRKDLALHCLSEALWERIRQPTIEPFDRFAQLTDTEPVDTWPDEMRGGIDVLRRHGLDDDWQVSFLDTMLGLDLEDGAAAKAFADELRTAVDDLPNLHAFLMEIVPLARLELFRYGSPRDPEARGTRTQTIDVHYRKGSVLDGLKPAFGEVELVRVGSNWRIDAIRVD